MRSGYRVPSDGTQSSFDALIEEVSGAALCGGQLELLPLGSVPNDPHALEGQNAFCR